jgi:hypothetical protein
MLFLSFFWLIFDIHMNIASPAKAGRAIMLNFETDSRYFGLRNVRACPQKRDSSDGDYLRRFPPACSRQAFAGIKKCPSSSDG